MKHDFSLRSNTVVVDEKRLEIRGLCVLTVYRESLQREYKYAGNTAGQLYVGLVAAPTPESAEPYIPRMADLQHRSNADTFSTARIVACGGQGCKTAA